MHVIDYVIKLSEPHYATTEEYDRGIGDGKKMHGRLLA